LTDLRSRVQESLAPAYTLEHELGGGGMSRVFVATEQRLGRKVVVKLLSPELAATLSTSRFEREIQVAASLQQANIVPVLAAGDVDGLPYYTMPYIEGESLRARLSRGPLPTSETVSILRDVARALAYAHARGVVHRDIKPDNVLLSGHTAVVTDFGIAKAIAAAAEGPTGATLTQLGTAVGTPAYMAPEQAAGDPATDHRADIYAFGCLAYELIAGRQPFAGLPQHKLLFAHMSEMPQAVGELRADCPPALAALVMQCLAKDPLSRPGSADELLRRLDAVASPASAAALPSILIGGRPTLFKVIVAYAVAFIVVAVVARAAIIAIGLPDWVFPGALIVMALGLPIVLVTAYTQYVAHRAASATPTYTPGGTQSLGGAHGTMATLAIKASPHLSWQRTVRGGIIAVTAFTLIVAGFMTLRAMGIGPAGTLMASGKLASNARIVVASFDAPGADSSLGSTIGEAVKTNLAESKAVRVVPTSAVVATLEQMQRPDTAKVDFTTAREIAQRSGAKAVVAGSVVSAGAGYVITVRLVSAETGNDLASFSESAKDAGDLIPAIDRVTRKLRGKMGESLKSVHDAPPLEQVTTASIGALKSYAEGLRQNDQVGDYVTAIQSFNDAIRQDSNFAMAWVQVAYSHYTIGGAAHTAAGNAAMTRGFQLRNRLPDRERYNVEGAYYLTVLNDHSKAIPAFRRAVALDSTDLDPANSLAVAYSDVNDHDNAVAMYGLALRDDSMNGTLLNNLAQEYLIQGDHAHVDSVLKLFASRHIAFPTGPIRYSDLWNRHQYDSAEALAHVGVDSAGTPLGKANAEGGVQVLARLKGRLQEAERLTLQTTAMRARFAADTASPYDIAAFHAVDDGLLRGDVKRGVADLDAALQANPLGSIPAAKDNSTALAWDYAMLGEPAKARDVLNKFVARADSQTARENANGVLRTRALIAMDEGRTDSAIAYIRKTTIAADGMPTSDCLCVPYLLGIAYDRGHNADSARKYLGQYVDRRGAGGYNLDPQFLALSLQRLGELYEQAGDTKRAIDYYTRFIDLWKNSDPDLQPRVNEVKAKVAALTRGKG
jgi:tetratricopeptide (TPR) repeat protein/tRNA A-37 threonylcarbamoyl transferase component Bud32